MKSHTAATTCFNAIYQLILDGELSPGEKLKGEYLKQKFNVGLSPVREALFRLTETPFVKFQDKVGFSVATLSANRIYDMFETHTKIECLMLKESIEHGDDEWEARVMSSLYKLAKVENNTKVAFSIWTTRNDDFHNALVSGCKIDGLVQIRNNCLTIRQWYNNLANKNNKKHLITTNHNEHAKIAELAITREIDLSCSKLYDHTMTVVGMLIKKLKTDGYITN